MIVIHGFNVPFEGAIKAAGQLTFDTAQDFSSDDPADDSASRRVNQRAALAVDWASWGSLFHYDDDRDRVERAANMLAGLLEDLGRNVSTRTAGRGFARL